MIYEEWTMKLEVTINLKSYVDFMQNCVHGNKLSHGWQLYLPIQL